MTSDERIDAIASVAHFLVYAESAQPNMMYGGRKITDALNALCDLTGMPRDVLRERILLDTMAPGDDRHD